MSISNTCKMKYLLKQKMKLLIISNMYPDPKHPTYGIFVQKICSQLSSISINYELSVMHKADSKSKKIIYYIRFYIYTMAKLLCGKYDAIYIHYASYSALPVLITNKIQKKKIIVNVHGTDVLPITKSQKRMELYTKKIMKLCDLVIVPSQYFKDCVHEKYYISHEKIKVYPSGGIDQKIFFERNNSQLKKIKKNFRIDETLLTFGLACRIASGKGWDVYIEAINELIKQNIKANFILVGNGPEEKKLNHLINKYNLESKILRFGLMPQHKLSEFYSVLDFFVFPTESESLGLVALEAMACGTPVLASNCSALKYYIKNGINGYKFEPGNIIEISELIKYICIKFDKISYDTLAKGAIATATPYLEKNIISDLKKIFYCELE